MKTTAGEVLKGIRVAGAREHNLRSIHVVIPRNKMTIVTGLSGSGKSSLVFDTVYAESQRRYVESLSSYARFFIDKMKRPDLDSITGLSPAVAIDQRAVNSSPRSTVGTVAETSDYLRLLFARLGQPHCVVHNKALTAVSLENIASEIIRQKKGEKCLVLAPTARGKKGEFAKEFGKWLSLGWVKARVDGEWLSLDKAQKLSKRKDHVIDVLIDRLVLDRASYSRLKDSLHQAASLTGGFIKIEGVGKSWVKNYSTITACPVCLAGFPALEPKLFSFNHPKGACTKCAGLGYESSEEFLEEDEEEEYDLEKCTACRGLRLNPFALSVKIKNKNIADLSAMSLSDLDRFLKKLKFVKYKIAAEKILEKLKTDLSFFQKIGLGYLSLDRPILTLSGGEAQRIRLMSQISSPLIGVLYVLDEPSIGLHPKDHDKLLNILFQMKDRGNTILMVEHDEKTIKSADYVIDLGPLAGCQGGEVVAEGSVKKIMRSKKSLTGAYLSGRKKILTPGPLKPLTHFLEIQGAAGNNLKNLNVKIPLGCLVGVTGVSGSGKSTLVMDTLYKALRVKFCQNSLIKPAPFKKIKGLSFLDKVLAVNQKPIGRTPRSVPATYTGVMSYIRGLMSRVPLAKIRGFTPGDFSFNMKGGRCESCRGAGLIKQEMAFLPSSVLVCEMCQGLRYTEDILNIRYKGKNIYDILSMNISQAGRFFEQHRFLKSSLDLLEEVGLGYLTLGQSSMSLSGGEAQRIKLVRELAKKNTGRTLYILDEPTTGLHFKDIEQLLFVLKKLRDKGSTVVVIEHQMDVIRSCDYLIDLGPGGGEEGGRLTAQGRPFEVMKAQNSATAPFLRKALKTANGK